MIRHKIGMLGLVGAIALTGCASDDWEGRYNDLHSELIDVAAERDQTHEKLVDSLARQEALDQQEELRRQELEALSRELDEASRRANEYAAQNEELKQRSETVTQEPPIQDVVRVADDLRRSGIPADVDSDGNLVIALPADITFPSGEAKLTKSGRGSIQKLAPKIQAEYPGFEIVVEGHTDNEPLKRVKDKWNDNYGLAAGRANAVVRYMVDELGFTPTRLTSVSRGEHVPVASNATKDGRARNRRVEIKVVIPEHDAGTIMAR